MVTPTNVVEVLEGTNSTLSKLVVARLTVSITLPATLATSALAFLPLVPALSNSTSSPILYFVPPLVIPILLMWPKEVSVISNVCSFISLELKI